MRRNRIGLGVSGGIAAYKAVEVMRLLQKAGCDVQVAMTRHATEFVQPLTFRALTEKHVIVDDYDPENPDPIAHINFSQNIDLLLIVPATANIIAKFANGIADDFLTSTYLAATAPVMLAPAMNTTMWEHRATQRNIRQLKKDGVQFVEPVSGELACKTIGTGKLEDVENIVAQALRLLGTAAMFPAKTQSSKAEDGEGIAPAKTQSSKDEDAEGIISARLQSSKDQSGKRNDLSGEKMLLTVGGTREAIDPVRFISNHSSGKMGFAVAEAAAARGASVSIVAGVTTVNPPKGISLVRAITAERMHDAVMRSISSATVFVGAAAVADYAPAEAANAKIKKEGKETMNLELKKTPDILADVGKNRHSGLLVIGFAAETENVLDYARSKMKKKRLDIVVANDITKEGAGFNTDTNIVTIITRKGEEKDFPLMSKHEIANIILDEIVKLRKGK